MGRGGFSSLVWQLGVGVGSEYRLVGCMGVVALIERLAREALWATHGLAAPRKGGASWWKCHFSARNLFGPTCALNPWKNTPYPC